MGCVCNAYSSSECTCGVDWTPSEVYELKVALIKARDALQLCRPEHVTRPAINAINEVLK
jgi:hypothetical protein